MVKSACHRCRLRPSHQDFQAVSPFITFPSLISHLPDTLSSQKELLAVPTVAERNATFFKQTTSMPLKAIRHKAKFIGCISLATGTTKPVVEMGYYLYPSYQGKRILRDAGRKALRYAANEFGMQKIIVALMMGIQRV